ncbi:Glucose-6-phosphate 1-dehydrogenase [Serratia marcescens]|uniref:Glucose-6-phosphate 1-dehydrogenase n=1 Tax=Serratia marcescens TaxID=615 RepID=A0A379ZBG7_SERMA|nr:Glucose-6-phosphate 1-dehydrogenase [Serratia marcescens]
MAVTSTAQACDLVIFGAKGDLARRKLLPSLYQLEKAGHIHPGYADHRRRPRGVG